MNTNNLTVVVTHCEDQVYLLHCLDILRSLTALKGGTIWVDGYGSVYSGSKEMVSSVTTHGQPHGVRSFELLSMIKTEFVIVMDADFFCADERFWEATFESLDKSVIVGVGQPWHFSINLPTTPFVAYRRLDVLSMVPEKAAWNHFGHIWPNLPEPLFDHLKFLFLIAASQKLATCIDQWYPVGGRKYSFFHFWDSRHRYEKNFSDFANTALDEKMRHQYLSFGLSKCIFHHLRGELISPELWSRIADAMKYKNQTTNENLMDVMKNLEPQLRARPDWQKKMRDISERFFNEYGR
jgi:hypothetical protein